MSQPMISPTPSHRKPVLIVDDNRDTADSIALLLTMEGYPAKAAYAAEDALDLLDSETPFGALICDVRMPDLDGFDLFRAVRHRFPDLRIVLVTGKDIMDDDGVPHGATVLRKPVEARALLAALSEV